MRTLLFPCLLWLGAVASCGGGTAAPPTSSVYRTLGSVQCTGGGTSLATLQRQLTDAGVTIVASSCGTDGMIRPAVCGAPDGAIGIFDVPAEQVDRALGLAFARLTELPGATRGPCR